MRRHQILTTITLAFLLLLGMLWTTAPFTRAIGEVTPTPTPSATTLTEDEIEELLNEAIGHLQSGNFEDAVNAAGSVITADPTNPDAYFVRAVAHTQLGNFELAIDDFTRAIENRPYDWTVYTMRAETYMRLDQINDAMQDYDRAIYINPRYEQAYRSRAGLQFQRGNETAARIDDMIARGISAAAAGNSNAAIDLYTDAIALVEDQEQPVELANAYYNRALSFFDLGLISEAIDDYTRAIELDPEMQDAYMGRGFTYADQEQPEDAGRDFKKRMELLQRELIEGEMSIGEIVEIQMDYGRVHRIEFEGEAGRTVTISARAAAAGVDPLLVLLGPDGEIMGDDDGGGELDSRIPSYTLPASGSYTLLISHANGGYVGPINVSVR